MSVRDMDEKCNQMQEKNQEMNEHAVRFGFSLTLLEAVDEAGDMVVVTLRE